MGAHQPTVSIKPNQHGESGNNNKQSHSYSKKTGRKTFVNPRALVGLIKDSQIVNQSNL